MSAVGLASERQVPIGGASLCSLVVEQAVQASNEWSSSESWFLAAVALAEARGANDLSGVVETGDFVNHSILNLDEIEQAVARLRSARLITEADGRFFLTREGTHLWDSSPESLPLRKLMWLKDPLRAFRFDPAESWHLSPNEYRDALTAYRERFARAYDRLNRQYRSE